MYDKVISFYCIIDDIFKKINHQEDCRVLVVDFHVLTTALIAAKYFFGNNQSPLNYLKSNRIFSNSLVLLYEVTII